MTIAVCPCCRSRIVTIHGSPPLIFHGNDRLSGEPCPREDWPVEDAVQWEDGAQATTMDFPEVYADRA